MNSISLAWVGKQLTNEEFVTAVRHAVSSWRASVETDDAVALLEDPAALGRKLVDAIDEYLAASGKTTRAEVKTQALTSPYLHLANVFDPRDLPETPIAFSPVPVAEGTLLARATAIACIAALDSETISYGSENSGELFVNLVVMPAPGYQGQKSRGQMKGHTDGVYFPIRGKAHEENPKISPSPDFVCLCALRNPNDVPTNVMPLTDILRRLSPEDVAQLQMRKYSIAAQRTFTKGLAAAVEGPPLLEYAQLLYVVDGTFWVRYSHSSTDVTDVDDPDARRAMSAFEDACLASVQPLPLVAGDIVLVNNRAGLHGRSEVGAEHGGETRWLLRTYALDTSGLTLIREDTNKPYKLYP
ncbi:TPA: TauD/TfdA family dioxygenase [Pseudomonas aeruginosa]|nr:TauD/TfdA family dioxygenase [Pseudomonas aeruginosa]HBO4702808.1 TauD/TfdA family dioxygenase [Pseudomonas aeruginosa]